MMLYDGALKNFSKTAQRGAFMNERNTIQNPGQFHSLAMIDFSKIKQLDELLNNVFPLTVNQHGADKIINEEFLLHFLYGILSIKNYKPITTLANIKEKIEYIYKETKCNDVARACKYFLLQLQNLVETSSLQAQPSINSFVQEPLLLHGIYQNKLNNHKSIDQKSYIDEVATKIANDILRMNAAAYLGLSMPVTNTNLLTTHFNQLYTVLANDIKASRSHTECEFKIEVYLAVANKLLTNEGLIDFHGAAAISLVLSLKPNEIMNPVKEKKEKIRLNSEAREKLSELTRLCSEQGNYKKLRDKTSTAYELALSSELNDFSLISSKKSLKNNCVYLSVKNDEQFIIYTVKSKNAEVIKDGISNQGIDALFYSRLYDAIKNKTLETINLEEKIKLLEILRDRGHIDSIENQVMPFFMVINKDLLFAAENNLYDQIMLSGKIYHQLSERVSYIKKYMSGMQIEYQTDLFSHIHVNALKMETPRQGRREDVKPRPLKKRRASSITMLTEPATNLSLLFPPVSNLRRSHRSSDSLPTSRDNGGNKNCNTELEEIKSNRK
jgi:hypothetical protein